jgi:hypothetical protein
MKSKIKLRLDNFMEKPIPEFIQNRLHWKQKKVKDIVQSTRNHFIEDRKVYFKYFSLLVFYLSVGFIFPAFLNPYSNLLHRMILFILLALPIIIVVYFDDNRRVIILGLIMFNIMTLFHSIFYPYFFSGLTLIFPIFQNYIQFVNILALYDDTGKQLLLILRYAYIIDLTLVLIFSGIASLLAHTIVKIKRRESKYFILKILLVLFLITMLVIFPYAAIGASGLLHFGLAYSSGSTQLQLGWDEITESGNTNLALKHFIEAKNQYEMAEILFEELRYMDFFNFLMNVDPNLRPLIENGEILIEASFLLSSFLLPLIHGLIDIEDSFAIVSLNDLEPGVINKTKDLIEKTQENFVIARDSLVDIVKLISQVNITTFVQALKDNDIGDYEKELGLMFYSSFLLNSSLDLFLLHILPFFEFDYPLHYALESIIYTREIQNRIGNQSRYSSVLSPLLSLITNLQILSFSLNRDFFPQYRGMETLNVGGYRELRDARTQFLGVFNFIRDLVDLGLGLGYFGVDMVQTLNGINSSLLPLTSELQKFPNISPGLIEESISVTNRLRENTTIIQDHASELESIISIIDFRSQTKYYGIFANTAKLIVNIFWSYELSKNADNFYHLSSAVYYLLNAINEFQGINSHVNEIEGNITRLEENPTNPQIIGESINNIENSMNSIKLLLIVVRGYFVLTKYHLNQIDNMPEADQLLSIIGKIEAQMDRIDVIEQNIIKRINDALLSIEDFVSQEIIDNIRRVVDEFQEIYDLVDEQLKLIDIESEEIKDIEIPEVEPPEGF